MRISPICGLVLSGLTGVGKSTLQRMLLELGCWTPELYTSRQVDSSTKEPIEYVPRDRLENEVLAGMLVAPVIFADNLYAWRQADFHRLKAMPEGAVLTTRPYTALLLGAAIPKLIPVWLDLSETERMRRLVRRKEARDRDAHLTERRLVPDSEDLLYRPVFRWRIQSDETALPQLVERLEERIPSSTRGW